MFLTIEYPKIETNISNLNFAIIVSLIVILGLLAILISYHFIKYYAFFLRMKFSSLKAMKKKCTWTRGGFICWQICIITIQLIYIGAILVEFILYCLINEEYIDFLYKVVEIRKALMYLIMHLYSFTILLLYYYVALNQQRKELLR